MKDTIKLFIENYLHDKEQEYIFVTTDEKENVKGRPINPADDIILYTKIFLDHTMDTSNISIDDIRNELISQKIIFEASGLYLTYKRVKTTKLLEFVSRTNSNNIVSNNDIMKAIKNLPNIISVNTSNSINKMRDQMVNIVDEIYESNNEEFKKSMRTEHTDFMHKFSIAIFDMIETLKPRELQKGEDNYSLPEEMKKIISECLLNAQQQNEETIFEVIDQRETAESKVE